MIFTTVFYSLYFVLTVMILHKIYNVLKSRQKAILEHKTRTGRVRRKETINKNQYS